MHVQKNVKFMMLSHLVLLKVRMLQTKVVEKIELHILCLRIFSKIVPSV